MLDNIYGSTWLTSGLGSVRPLSGQPGSDEVTAFHVKQPAETVGPTDIRHDHHAGVSSAVNLKRLTVPQFLAMGGSYSAQELAALSGKSTASVRRELRSTGAVEIPGANTSEGREPSRWQSPVSSPVARTWG